MSECPNCGNGISMDDVQLSELVICTECGSDLEIVSIDPPILENAPEEEEDWGE